MAVSYKAVLWNKFKKKYDLYIILGVILSIVIMIGLQLSLRPNITIETLIIRTTAIVAFLMLHFILIIGPLCRINVKFLPLLYNRRHLGVSMFLIATIHGVFCLIQFHSLGDVHPIISLFKSNLKYQEISQFPFQTLGFISFIILFVMAATSHDFWLKNLSPRTWKSLHMLVYIAYGLLILHVATGILQYETSPVYWVILLIGFLIVVGLHLIAGMKGIWANKLKNGIIEDHYHLVGNIDNIKEDRAKIVRIKNQEIAIFKYDGKLSAVHNVCKHQMGPLGEGKIIDGCITCPWHGYQYLPHNGQSPPPFKEKINTYALKLMGNQVWVDPNPFQEGTEVEPLNFKDYG
jgi:nitrite reductase/ring-hydroxylating ferredoxin subunit/DMSO/TMAO reductase YedYZ heme-binding membrane subunit